MDTEIVTETVDVTDDLDSFSDEFFGTTSEPKAEITPEEVPSETQDEPEVDAPEPNEDAPEPEAHDDEPSDDEGEGDSEDNEETKLFKVKRKKPVGERIRELTAARHEAERETAALRARLDAIEAERNSAETKPKAAVAPAADLAADAPDPDEQLDDGAQKYPLGEFDPKYIRDLTRFTIKVEREAAKVEEAQAAEENQMKVAEQALQSAWTEKLEAAKETIPDIGERAVELEDTFRNIDPNYGKYLAATIMSMERGPEVLHYLATNIGEAKKIVASGPTAATLALGRLEARFAVTEKVRNETPRTSRAPTPPPSNRGSGGKFSVAPDTDDLDAFEKSFFSTKVR